MKRYNLFFGVMVILALFVSCDTEQSKISSVNIDGTYVRIGFEMKLKRTSSNTFKGEVFKLSVGKEADISGTIETRGEDVVLVMKKYYNVITKTEDSDKIGKGFYVLENGKRLRGSFWWYKK